MAAIGGKVLLGRSDREGYLNAIFKRTFTFPSQEVHFLLKRKAKPITPLVV